MYRVNRTPEIVFCFDFCAYHVWGPICPRLIWGLSKVTEVEKRESRKSFLKPRPHFWGRGHRPRPRNEQAEAEKCFRDSLFSTEVTEDISNQMWTHFFKDSGKHKNWNRMFFSFVWLFRGVYKCYFGSHSVDFEHFSKTQILKKLQVFWPILYGENSIFNFLDELVHSEQN